MSIFKSPFEKLSIANQQEIAEAVWITAESVSPGGALFNKIDDLVKAIKTSVTAKSNASASPSGSFGSAVMMRLIGSKALTEIGKGLKLIVDAINSLQGTAKETKAKMEAIVLGVDSISQIGPGILKFAGYMALAAPLLLVGAVTAPLFALSVWLITKAIEIGTKPLANPRTKLALEGLSDIAWSILALGAVMVLAVPLYAFGIKALPYIATTLVILGGAFFILDKLGIADSIKKVSIGLSIAAGAILALSFSLFFSAIILEAIPNKWETLFSIVGIIAVLGLTFGIIGKFASEIVKGAIVMSLVAIPIALIGLSIGLFSAMIPPTEAGWVTLAQVGTALLGIGTAFALAGAVATLIIPGAIALGMAGLAMIVIGVGLTAFANLFKSSAADNLLADSGHVTDSFLGFGGGRMMSKMEYFMYSLANSFLLNPLAISSMYASAPAMILAGMSLFSIAKGIEAFQKLKINYDVLPLQIEKVTTVLANTFGKIGEKFPGGRNFLSFVGLGSQSAVADGIDAVLGMGNALASIAQGTKAMADLRFPIYQGTKIVGYHTLNSGIFDRVSLNTQMLTSGLANIFGEIGTQYPGGSSWLSGLGVGQSSVADGIDAVNGMGNSLAEIAKGVQEMANLRFPIYKNGKIVGYQTLNAGVWNTVRTNIQSIVSGLSDVFGKIGKSPDAEDTWGWFGKSNIERGISLVEDFSDPIVKLINTGKSVIDAKFDPLALKNKILGTIDAFTSAYAKVGTNKILDAGLISLTGELAQKIQQVSQNVGGFERFVNSYGRYVDHFIRFKNTVNQFDKENLKLTNEIFQGLTYLTKTDNAIEEMGEQLATAIDKLAKMIEESKNTIKSTGEQQSNIMQEVGNGVSSFADKVKGFFTGESESSPTSTGTQRAGSTTSTQAPVATSSMNQDALIAAINELIARFDNTANPIRVRQV